MSDTSDETTLLAHLGFPDWGYETFDEIVAAAKTQPFKEGMHFRVYPIPFVDSYMLRESKFPQKPRPFYLCKDPLPHRSVAQALGVKDGCQIVRKQMGIAVGIPKNPYNTPKKEHPALYREYVKHVDLMAEMPQSAYSHLANVLNELNPIKYILDFSTAQNLMVDPYHGEINPVDLTCMPKEQNHFGDLLFTVLDVNWSKDFGGKARRQMPDKLEAIFLKTCVAAVQAGLPIPPLRSDIRNEAQYLLTKHYFLRLGLSLSLLGMRGQWPTVRNALLEAGGAPMILPKSEAKRL
jgi:hypothetical protein